MLPSPPDGPGPPPWRPPGPLPGPPPGGGPQPMAGSPYAQTSLAGWPAREPGWAASGAVSAPPRRGRAATAVLAAALAACMIAAVAATAELHGELARKPTSAELSRAGATAVARRWQAWPVGRIFPPVLPFAADLGVSENATRIAIDHPAGCGAAVDAAVEPVLARYGCRGVLRASYLDQRQAVVFTIGVMAFPNTGAATAARARISPGPQTGLRTLAIAGTPSAWFADDARQAATVTAGGPYVVFTVAGYADGRPAVRTAEPRPLVFAPASQLAQTVLTSLNVPADPRCGAPGWAC